jgi:hypothetical protein
MSSKQSPSFAKIAEPFVCGGAAASFASVIIHPIDLAKVGHFIAEKLAILCFCLVDANMSVYLRCFRSECSCTDN